MPLDPTGHLVHYYQDIESKQLYLIYRNKHREAAKTRRQRNMAQMKKQIKTPEKELKRNGDKQSIKCRVQNTIYKDAQELCEDLNSIKKIQSEKKDTLVEIKNHLQGNNSSMDEAKNQINDLEQKEAKNNHTEQEKRIQKNEDSIKSLWDNYKRFNTRIIGVPLGEEKEEEIGNLSEKIVKENFPNLLKEIDMQIQEVLSIPNKMDAKRPIPRHIIIRRLKIKDKERLLKAATENS